MEISCAFSIYSENSTRTYQRCNSFFIQKCKSSYVTGSSNFIKKKVSKRSTLQSIKGFQTEDVTYTPKMHLLEICFPDNNVFQLLPGQHIQAILRIILVWRTLLFIGRSSLQTVYYIPTYTDKSWDCKPPSHQCWLHNIVCKFKIMKRFRESWY